MCLDIWLAGETDNDEDTMHVCPSIQSIASKQRLLGMAKGKTEGGF